jgi:serine/threonine protein kinase
VDLKHRRKVAIKVLREDLSRSMGSARFLREIQIAAPLQHPNILPLFDSGDAGRAYRLECSELRAPQMGWRSSRRAVVHGV